MRVLIDTSFAARGPSGTAVYVERLVAALRARGEVEVVEARDRRRLRPGRAGGRLGPLRSAANALLDLAWTHATLPRAARRAEADVVHHPLPARSALAGAAQVVTVHDVAFERLPERFDPLWRRLAGRTHRAALRRADAIVCVSEATAADAVELLGARRERVVVAPHGPGQGLPRLPRPAEPSHFLYVGDDEPRKNLDGLLAAYAGYRAAEREPLDLVLAGASAARAAGPGVRGEPRPAPERLAELLAAAAALAHPSLHEGFGLTLAEAMAAGAPVVAVRNPGTEELCGGAALLVAADRLTSGLRELHSDVALRERLGRAGRERAARLSWDECARLHERAYKLARQQATEAQR